MSRPVAIAAIAALLYCPAAAAHGGGAAKGYHSTVNRVTPITTGLAVRVLDGDDRLELRNGTGKTIVITGYENEPYLRFTPNGVYRNTRSPATYLNDDRYGKVAVPTAADPKAPPRWEKVASQSAYDWHDHRIHWMSANYPPAVEAGKDKPHHIFNWTVAGTSGGKPLRITGSLDFEPLPGRRFPKILLIPLVLLAVLGAAVWWLRMRRSSAHS